MKKLCLIVILVISICSGTLASELITTDRPDGKVDASIVLQNTSPESIMWSLNLFTLNDLALNKTSAWPTNKDNSSTTAKENKPAPPVIDPTTITKPASQQNTASSIDMSGINNITLKDHALIVCGDKTSVERFAEKVSSMDVPQKQVEVRVEIARVEADKANKLINDDIDNFPSKFSADDFRALLSNGEAETIYDVTLNTLNNVPTMASWNNNAKLFQVIALPRINEDGTITLLVNPKILEDAGNAAEARAQELLTQRRIANGGSVILGGFITKSDGDEVETVFLLTAKLVN